MNQKPMRFISIIIEPGKIWSDYGVVDTLKNVMICKSSDAGYADTVSKCLNLQWISKGRDAPIALLAPTFEELDAEIAKHFSAI